jgi:hypothetical protein
MKMNQICVIVEMVNDRRFALVKFEANFRCQIPDCITQIGAGCDQYIPTAVNETDNLRNADAPAKFLNDIRITFVTRLFKTNHQLKVQI